MVVPTSPSWAKARITVLFEFKIEAISNSAGSSVSLPVISERVTGPPPKPQKWQLNDTETNAILKGAEKIAPSSSKKEENKSRTPSHSSISCTSNSTFEDPFDIAV